MKQVGVTSAVQGGGEAAGVAQFAAAIVSRREMPILAHQLRQLGDIRCDPSRLIFAEQLGR